MDQGLEVNYQCNVANMALYSVMEKDDPLWAKDPLTRKVAETNAQHQRYSFHINISINCLRKSYAFT